MVRDIAPADAYAMYSEALQPATIVQDLGQRCRRLEHHQCQPTIVDVVVELGSLLSPNLRHACAHEVNSGLGKLHRTHPKTDLVTEPARGALRFLGRNLGG